MKHATKYSFTSSLLLSVFFFAKIASAASVPMVSQWGYYSPNNSDYRSFGSGTMTVDVTDPETAFSTMPRAMYPAGQDFTVSVAFSNFTTQGNATNDTSGPSNIGLALKWDLDNGVASQVVIGRQKFSDDHEVFSTIYHDYGENYSEIHDSSIVDDNVHTSGVFTVSKVGNSVTVSAKDTTGVEIHSKTFSSVNFQNEITIILGTVNGPREATSVQFSNLDMDPVPVNIVDFIVRRNVNSEENSVVNSAAFSVVDTSGNFVESDVLTSFQLFSPSGAEIPFYSSGFEGNYNAVFGRYDSTNGRWIYGSSFITQSSYKGKFSENPVAGDYHLVANTTNGSSYHRYIHYNGEVSLFDISSTSFYSYKDEHGNLHFSWKVPYDQSFIDANINTSARAWIDVYSAGVLKSEVWVNIPTFLGHIFVPREVVQLYESEGTDYRVGVQIRTNDGGQNRSYTKTIPLVLAKGAPVTGDANGDGKIGLEEVIHALKVSAGN